MTLIKGTSAIARRAAGFRSALAAALPAADAGLTIEAPCEPDERDVAAARLTSRVTEIEAALAAARDEQDAVREAAFEHGRAAGKEEAETLERERLETLAASLREAVDAFGDQVGAARDIAIDLARAALDRLFADPSLYRGMVAETARRQASVLTRGTIIALRVSAIDFPDETALAALRPLGPDVRVETDPSLAGGACLFDLTLGMLDASISRQAAVIEGVFAQAERKAASA